MHDLRTLTLTLAGYLVTTGAISGYFWGIGGPPFILPAHLVATLYSLLGALCAWLCYAASTSRPSPIAFAVASGFAAATSSYAVSVALRWQPGSLPPLWYWSLPAGGGTLLTLWVQRHSKLRLRSELGVSIFAAFGFGCVLAYAADTLLKEQGSALRYIPEVLTAIVCTAAALLVFVRAGRDAFQLSWAAGVAILLFGVFSAGSGMLKITDGKLMFTLMSLVAMGLVPVSFCFEAVRAIRAQAAQSGEWDAAIRDALTGLYNRRALDTMGKEMYRQVLRGERPVSVLMFDIDHFKQVNDLHGHAAGDTILARFAEIISQNLRTSDFVARYGGEEFAAILPGAPLAPALRLAERIRLAIAAADFTHEGTRIKLTTSIGATTDFPGENRDFRELIQRADKNLYRAKRSGRNQVATDPLQDDPS